METKDLASLSTAAFANLDGMVQGANLTATQVAAISTAHEADMGSTQIVALMTAQIDSLQTRELVPLDADAFDTTN